MQYPTLGVHNWDEEWDFVKRRLEENGFDTFGGGCIAAYPFRSRFQHTMRVMNWAKRILLDRPKVDLEVLELAIIFHDVGYCMGDNTHHQKNSATIFHEYREHKKDAEGIWLDDRKLDFIEWLIENHSMKGMLATGEAPDELVMLMEADVLDEEGAMRIAWDNMAAGVCGAKSFAESLERTEKYWGPDYMPMITPLAKNFFEKKQAFVKEYIWQMKFDLGLVEEV